MKLSGRMFIIANLASLPVALAQVPASSDIQNGMQPEMQPPLANVSVQERNKNGFTYVCGGVGSDESAYLKQIAKNYDLMSTFARRDGSYLADINIAIKDKRGQAALKITCPGPMMLVKFPHPGTYQIQAEVGDSTVTETIQIPAKGHPSSKVFEWPASWYQNLFKKR